MSEVTVPAQTTLARPHRYQLVRGAAGTLLLKLVSTALILVTNLLFARILGADSFGIYAYGIAWATFLTTVGLFGLDVLLVREVSAFVTRGENADLAGLLNFAFTLGSGAAVAFAIGAIGVASIVLASNLGPFALAMLLVPAYVLTRLTQSAMRGIHNVIMGQVPELAIRPLLAFSILIVLWLTAPKSFTPSLALAIQAIAAVATLAIALLQFRRSFRTLLASQASYKVRTWLGSAIPLLLLGGMQVINRQADILLVGIFLDLKAVGIYTVATRGAELISFVLFAVNAGLAPLLAKFHAANQAARFQRAVTVGAWSTFLLSVPPVFIFLVFGRTILQWFGSDFADGYPVLVVLSVAQLVNAAAGSVGNALTMSGHERDAASALAAAAAINVALNLSLIPLFGLLGAALASGASMVTWNFLLAILLHRRTGVRGTILGGLPNRLSGNA